MRRIIVLIFSLMWLLAGCQEEGNPLPSPSPISEPILPSATVASTSTATSTAIPSETPASTPLPPTPDPREFAVKTRQANVWDSPENENKYANLQTQLILWEKVLVMDRQGEWSKIVAVEQPSKKDPLGYPGWVRSEFLTQGWPVAQRYAVVMTPYVQLRVEPEGSRWISIYLDTRLPVESTRDDWVQVRLPDGRTGLLPLRDVRLTDDLSSPMPTDGLFDLAEALVGVPYRWGGTTSDSLDCSGFFYRVFHAYGITLSRDADDLALGGKFVDQNNLQKGDMIFTSETRGGSVSHVAMYWGNNTVLDAAAFLGVTKHPMAVLFYEEFWITARRFLP